jgi:CheY-like chemotaxis protein
MLHSLGKSGFDSRNQPAFALKVCPSSDDRYFMTKVLLIEDDSDFSDLVAHTLSGFERIELSRYGCPDEAFKALFETPGYEPDLVICDLHMPFTSGEAAGDYMTSFEVGIQTLHELRYVFPNAKVIALSAAPRVDLVRIEQLLDPVLAFTKPRVQSELKTLLKELLETEAAAESQ